jgi:hypothetical protein
MEDVYWPVGRFHFWRDWHKTGKDHGQCTIIFQRRSFTTVYGKNTVVHERKRSVCGLRISPYTATEISDRNTGSCNTAKYGRIRSVNSMYTVVYGIVNGRKRPYTESVTIDLGYNFDDKYKGKFFVHLYMIEL